MKDFPTASTETKPEIGIASINISYPLKAIMDNKDNNGTVEGTLTVVNNSPVPGSNHLFIKLTDNEENVHNLTAYANEFSAMATDALIKGKDIMNLTRENIENTLHLKTDESKKIWKGKVPESFIKSLP